MELHRSIWIWAYDMSRMIMPLCASLRDRAYLVMNQFISGDYNRIASVLLMTDVEGPNHWPPNERAEMATVVTINITASLVPDDDSNVVAARFLTKQDQTLFGNWLFR